MSNLFKKAALFTDIHLGLKNNSIKHLDDCVEYIDWFTNNAKEQGCETCFFLGDFHHHRVTINLQTLSYSLMCLEKLNDTFNDVYFVSGNHDLYYRDRRDIYGVEWAKHLPNVHIVNDWFQEGDVSIIPWLVGEEYKKLDKIKSKYMLGHFELPHFKLNSLIMMPNNGTIQLEHLYGVEHVFSGHFHIRQSKNNVTYIGNAFPHDYTDIGDSDRGCMILEWGGKPEFHAWPDQPLYQRISLADLIEYGGTFLKPKMSLQVQLDTNVTYEESMYIKETFQEEHKLREVVLVSPQNNEHEKDNLEELSLNTVDDIIAEQITAISSEYFDTGLLLDIYKNL